MIGQIKEHRKIMDSIGGIVGIILPFLLVIIAVKLSHRKKKITKITIVISAAIALIIFIAVGIYTSNLLMNI